MPRRKQSIKLKLFEREVLGWLYESHQTHAFALACDGTSRAVAWELEKKGFVVWKGTNWGSYFFRITDAGIKHYTNTEDSLAIKHRSIRAAEHNYGLKSPTLGELT